MTNIRMIFRSKWMVAGVVCEILAFVAAVGNWFAGSWSVWQLLPNVALTLATLGAVMVAGRVAWDYHGRGLNEKQRGDVNDTVSNSSLNTTQREEVTQITESSGLNPHQQGEVNKILLGSDLNEIQKDAVVQMIVKSGLSPRQICELPAKLMDMYLWRMVSAQQSAFAARDYLVQAVHGRVAVLTNGRGGIVQVQFIEPPQVVRNCKREHDRDDGGSSTPFEIASAHLAPFANDTVIWRPPGNGGMRYVNGNTEPPIAIDGKQWVFSTDDCVPKRLDPRDDHYVLTRDHSGRYAWERKT